VDNTDRAVSIACGMFGDPFGSDNEQSQGYNLKQWLSLTVKQLPYLCFQEGAAAQDHAVSWESRVRCLTANTELDLSLPPATGLQR